VGGTSTLGSRPGRRPGLSRKQVEQIIRMQRDERSLGQIAIQLNKDVPMPGGGTRWSRQSVWRVLHTKYAQNIADEMLD
jgi:hypothetical protein